MNNTGVETMAYDLAMMEVRWSRIMHSGGLAGTMRHSLARGWIAFAVIQLAIWIPNAAYSSPPLSGWTMGRTRITADLRDAGSIDARGNALLICTNGTSLLKLFNNFQQVAWVNISCETVNFISASELVTSEGVVDGAEIYRRNVGNLANAFRLATSGNAAGSLRSVADIAVDETQGRFFVLDSVRGAVLAFNRSGYLYEWGSIGVGAGSLSSPDDLEIMNGNVVVRDYSGGHARLQLFSATGAFLRILRPGVQNTTYYSVLGSYVIESRTGELGVANLDSGSWQALGFPSPPSLLIDWNVNGSITFVSDTSRLGFPAGEAIELRNGYRSVDSLLRGNSPPLAEVSRVAGRSGSTLVEIDYQIRDPDSATADTVAFFLVGGNRSLTDFRRISTLVEGSAGRVGLGLAVNVQRTLVWDAAPDLGTSQPTFRGRVTAMARNNGQLLDLHFVTLPAGIPSVGDAALTISSIPVQDSELLGLWFWLLASSDSAVTWTNGEVRGVGGAYAGQLLASGDSTTTAGRAFLWERLGVREASAGEVTRARTGTTTGVQQYEPLKRVGANPIKVNEIGIDTGATTGTWLVKLAP